ncbi:hypothetical protein COCON_G00128370 [Conger conger]|uniref:Syndecan n=1 Tax=Conger conger TaxID=82655 RepID=A0A9Q1DEC1_CONCO|nr:hypothetical protein COCON_G00128370 [Conger conger]
MRNIWIILTLGLAAVLTGDMKFVTAQSPTPGDDLYLDDQQSGDYPVDDDDFNSGSGSGIGETPEEMATVNTLYIAPKAEPTQDSTKDFPPPVETTPRDTTRKPTRTDAPVPLTEETRSRNEGTSTTSPPRSAVEPFEVRSENLFQRTEVLAAVIAGGVIGFLFAIFLILLLVYRMRKKDEGSYDLGERKPSGAAYQKAPTKEFYA